ncbi:hypothetical protein NBRC116599_22840 [Aquicoccus sp. SU-CL01552]
MLIDHHRTDIAGGLLRTAASGDTIADRLGIALQRVAITGATRGTAPIPGWTVDRKIAPER